jgi:hypothetical protein
MYQYKNLIGLLFIGIFLLGACSKNNSNPNPVPPIVPPGFQLSYGDTIIYKQNITGDYIINPVNSAIKGVYTAFPDGIEIDTISGAINVSKSEMGLRYRIGFIPNGGKDTFNTVIMLSGINFLDGFYKLNSADSILKPAYNGSTANLIPGVNNGTIFDEGSNCNSNGCKTDVSNGIINLAQTVRNGVFGATPSNNDRHEFQLNYRINDKSGKSSNTIKVKLYYFNSMSEVSQEAYDIINSRQGSLLQSHTGEIAGPISAINTNPVGLLTSINGSNAVASSNRPAKPRPPCVFIVAQ